MSFPSLNAIEARVLGCLLEKERLTPEVYPLSLNSLTNACNQSTNRDPVLCLEEREVERAIESLRERKLAAMIMGAGSRVQKYRHNLSDHYELDRRDQALVTVLLLRGPQTAGELRSRTERYCSFNDLAEVESVLKGLSEGADPLVRLLPTRPGQKEARWVELLSDRATVEPASGAVPASAEVPQPANPTRLDSLEQEIGKLKEELTALREEFATFKRQFE
jgi:uncharacterized protein YceH (UPF0502 family)